MAKLFIHKRLIVLFVIFVLFLVSTPLIAYWLGLSGVDGKPKKAAVKIQSQEVSCIWQRLKIEGKPSISSINPYEYLSIGYNFNGKPNPSISVAWRIASNYNYTHRKFQGMFWWHLTGAALTIWITRNWTSDEILAKVFELERDKGYQCP